MSHVSLAHKTTMNGGQEQTKRTAPVIGGQTSGGTEKGSGCSAGAEARTEAERPRRLQRD